MPVSLPSRRTDAGGFTIVDELPGRLHHHGGTVHNVTFRFAGSFAGAWFCAGSFVGALIRLRFATVGHPLVPLVGWCWAWEIAVDHGQGRRCLDSRDWTPKDRKRTTQ